VKRIEELLGMPIMTVQEGLRLGTVKGVELDTAEGRIRYLHFDGAGNRTDGIIAWESLRSVGSDAITVDSKDVVRETIPATDRDALTAYVGDRPVVTESGERVGTVKSYDVDEQTGRVDRYHVAVGGVFSRWMGNEVQFTHEAIRGFGKDAIIIADAVCAPKSS
jgi:sporulation protein YlmC with PRC-barrel domain